MLAEQISDRVVMRILSSRCGSELEDLRSTFAVKIIQFGHARLRRLVHELTQNGRVSLDESLDRRLVEQTHRIVERPDD